MVKLNCRRCEKSCKEKVVKHKDEYYHLKCFKCYECDEHLQMDGFFQGRDQNLYCEVDYFKLFTKKCGRCEGGLEGEVFSALDKIFHKKCFVCSLCCKEFQEEEKITAAGDEYMCSDCFDIPIDEKTANASQTDFSKETNGKNVERNITDKEPNFGKFYKKSYLSYDDRPIRRGLSINATEPSPKHYHRPNNFSYTQVEKDFVKRPKRESSVYLNNLEKEMDKVVTRTSKERGVEKVLMGLDNKEAVRLARLPDGRLKVKIDSKGYNEGIEKGDFEDKEKTQKIDKVGKKSEDEDNDVEIDLVTGLKRMKVNPALRIYGTTCNLSPSLVELFKQSPSFQVYSYNELTLTNFKLPYGVEKDSIEKHLSDEEFVRLFKMGRSKFYELPEWRRNDMKRKFKLF